MAGGEAGSEVVSGTDTLMSMISQAVAEQNKAMIEVLIEILEAIKSGDDGIVKAVLAKSEVSINQREFARLVKAVT